MSAIVVRTGDNRTIDLYLSDIPEGTTVAGAIAPAAADRLTHCKSMQFPEPSSDDIDTTDWDSPAKEFENGMTDFGEAQSVRNLNADEYESAMDIASAGANKALTIIVKNKTGTPVIKRQGFCTVKAPSVGNTEVDGVLEVTTTYKMSGDLAKFTGNLPT
jgi:hypothetical protein